MDEIKVEKTDCKVKLILKRFLGFLMDDELVRGSFSTHDKYANDSISSYSFIEL